MSHIFFYFFFMHKGEIILFRLKISSRNPGILFWKNKNKMLMYFFLYDKINLLKSNINFAYVGFFFALTELDHIFFSFHTVWAPNEET